MSQALLHLQDTAQALAWLRAQGVTSLTVDSRQVAAGTADAMGFIAWPGAARDGRAFVAQALSAGARACLVEAEGVEAFGFADARVAAVPGLKARSAEIAHGFYGEPSAALQVVAVTGTNGKTRLRGGRRRPCPRWVAPAGSSAPWAWAKWARSCPPA
jgi:UDP-N-acetylmuramyl tripeptide synthase